MEALRQQATTKWAASATGAAHERLIALGAQPLGYAGEVIEDLAALLAEVPLFSGLGAAAIERLGTILSVYEVRPAVTLEREGEEGDFMMLLMQGVIDVLRRNRHDYPSRIAVAHAGQALGEMSMLDGEPRFSSCVALEPSRIAVLTRDEFQKLAAEDPVLANRILLNVVRLLSERLRQASLQLVAQLEAARDPDAVAGTA